jgi:hypothetical protein
MRRAGFGSKAAGQRRFAAIASQRVGAQGEFLTQVMKTEPICWVFGMTDFVSFSSDLR